jgi:flagellin-like hook-associated protein FlgL
MGGFVIQHNLAAMNSQRQYNLTADRNFKSAEKLSSGYKINRAADDAAGLAISEKMRRQIRGLRQAEDNIQDGISFVQVADGALNETHDILQRMNELCVKGANDTLNDSDRSYINAEIQALKKETDRIFDTTSFNDRFIWNIEIEDPILVGHDPTQALNVTNDSSENVYITDKNVGYLPKPGTFTASSDSTNGVKVSWTGNNGNQYSSDYISWDDLEANDYDFNITDHLSLYSGTELDTLKSFLNKVIKMNVEPTIATIDDYVACLNNASLGTYYSNYATATFDNPGSINNVSISASIDFYAKEKSSRAGTADAYNFQSSSNDSFIEPSPSAGPNLTQVSGNGTNDITTAETSTDPWIFKFNIAGIGPVTATSTGVSWTSNDDRRENYGIWWDYYDRSHGITKKVSHDATNKGSLAGVMEALKGSTGVLSQEYGGDTNKSGNIYISFELKADTPYTGTNGITTDSVGSFTIDITVNTTDDDKAILKRVNDLLNSNTTLDLSHDGHDVFHWNTPSENSHTVEVPVYGGQIGMIIQSGSERDNDIPIYYEKLNNGVLGIRDLEITDAASAAAAIETVQKAFHTVTEQRSVFGAYQNRMEHAVLNDNNIRINTQDSESQIRDTNMAKEMVNYSLTNILKQSGESILAQANQSKQGVMSLLQ